MGKLVGVIGLIVIFAGIDLLWKSSHELRFWITTSIAMFRGLLRPQQPPRVLPWTVGSNKHHHAVRVLVGAGLVLVLGPILMAVSITLMLFYPNL